MLATPGSNHAIIWKPPNLEDELVARFTSTCHHGTAWYSEYQITLLNGVCASGITSI